MMAEVLMECINKYTSDVEMSESGMLLVDGRGCGAGEGCVFRQCL